MWGGEFTKWRKKPAGKKTGSAGEAPSPVLEVLASRFGVGSEGAGGKQHEALLPLRCLHRARD